MPNGIRLPNTKLSCEAFLAQKTADASFVTGSFVGFNLMSGTGCEWNIDEGDIPKHPRL